MKVIIAGSRPPKEIVGRPEAVDEWMRAVRKFIDASMEQVPFVAQITKVFSGQAAGVDTLGELWAMDNGIPVDHYPAKWRRPNGGINKGAGFDRNRMMASDADCLIAFWDGKSNGTKHMIDEMKRHGKPGIVFMIGDLQPAPKETLPEQDTEELLKCNRIYI